MALAALLAASPTFQEVWGAADAAEALEQIWLYDVDLEGEEGLELPAVVVDWAGDFDEEVAAAGSGGVFSSRGELRLTAFLEVPEEYRVNKRQALIWAGNVESAIFEEMRALCNQGTYLWVNRWRVLTPVLGPASGTVLTVEWDIFAGVGMG
ncbi:MAG: hypothetical protein HYV27_15300 [Candidatus Hydrogenedentes bacterium]|nr:hypothetical protein [Candidatus Hydrogenedentota bacterium]